MDRHPDYFNEALACEKTASDEGSPFARFSIPIKRFRLRTFSLPTDKIARSSSLYEGWGPAV